MPDMRRLEGRIAEVAWLKGQYMKIHAVMDEGAMVWLIGIPNEPVSSKTRLIVEYRIEDVRDA